MMRTVLSFFGFLLSAAAPSFAQFPPQAPLPGNDAVAKEDSRIVAWATGCMVQRGWQDIRDTTLGKATAGTESSALGAPSLEVLSLGDGGSAVLTFDAPIKDGPGADFAIFENGFSDPLNDTMAFLELAFVAVSSDGIHYVTFPSTCLIQDTVQIDQTTYGYADARLIHNLAGKYKNGYGTPFDLSELADSPGIDIQHIRYIRVTDVVGSIDTQYATYDHAGHIINDPFPTPFPTGGFDLNAVAVLHQQPAGISSRPEETDFKLWPVPARDYITVSSEAGKGRLHYTLYTIAGRRVLSGEGSGTITIDLNAFPAGVYFIRCLTEQGTHQTLTFSKW